MSKRAAPTIRKVSPAAIVLTSTALDLAVLADQLTVRNEKRLAMRVRWLAQQAHLLAKATENLRCFD